MSQRNGISDSTLGIRMRERREYLEKTLADVARECDVQSSAIMRYEKRVRYPSGYMFPRLAKALEVPIDWFFDDTVDPDGYDPDLVLGVPYLELEYLRGDTSVEEISKYPEVLQVPRKWISQDHSGFVVKVSSSPDRELIPDNCDVVVEGFNEDDTPGLGDVVLVSAMKTPCFGKVKFHSDGVSLSLCGESVSLNDVLVLGKVVRIAVSP